MNSTASKPTLTVAAISLTATADKAANIAQALANVRRAASMGADWVQLPEMFAYHGPYDQVWNMAEVEGGPLHQELSQLARELGIVLIAGSYGERPTGEPSESEAAHRQRFGYQRVYNTCYVFGRDGEQIAKYRKTHLFNLNHGDGTASYCESAGFLAGQQACQFSVDGWRVGLGVCYDLRFSRYFDLLEKAGRPDILVLPSAFTLTTGRAHWHLLLRARAVERQAYVFAANQVGTHSPGKQSYGHALIIDPWGEIQADSGDTPAIAIAQINKSRVDEVRAQLPAGANQRVDIYR